MNIPIEAYQQMHLFDDMEPPEIARLLDCLRARRVAYAKGDCIVEEGGCVCEFGVVLSGHARSVKWDPADRLVIISLLKEGSEIGVMIAASTDQKSPVTVQALDDVCVLHIPFMRVLARCEKACPLHDKLLRNYIRIVAQKGLLLHERIDCLLRPCVRDKILAYLKRAACEQQSATVSIPMNRNAMAEYLNVERSALSRELSHMKRDGILDYEKNMFRLLGAF